MKNRRSVIRSIGAIGALASGATGILGTTTAYETRDRQTVTLRANSGNIPVEKIQEIRRENFYDRSLSSVSGSGSTILSQPRSHRDQIVAYNLIYRNGKPIEYFGYYPKEDGITRFQSEAVNRIHSSADEHLERQRYASQESSNDFDDWEKHYEVTEELQEETGKLKLINDVYRYQDGANPDAYAIVSWGEMGGGSLSGVDKSVNSRELILKQDWESNADMQHDSRFPTSTVTGTQTQSWSVSFSLPTGVQVTGGESYSQPDVQTYDESDPWNDLGKWRVDISSGHTKAYTAHINPGSTAIVNRDECINYPYLPPVVPVAMVSVDAEYRWVNSDGIPETVTKSLTSGIGDSETMC